MIFHYKLNHDLFIFYSFQLNLFDIILAVSKIIST